MNNSIYQNVVGVDVSKETLDVFESVSQSHHVIGNDASAIARWVEQLTHATLVVMEATGGYENLLVDALHEARIDVAVVNPLQIRNFAKGCGMLEKTDKIDAFIIARFGQVVSPHLKKAPSENARKLRALNRRRDQILEQLGAERNRLQQTSDSDAVAFIEQSIEFYTLQLKQVQKRIAEFLKSPEFQETAKRLQTVPGVGQITIATLLTELPELGTINKREVAKLVGVAPIARDSGTTSRRRNTSAGRASIRRVLYMSALVATRHNPTMQRFYKRLIAKGKPKKVALVAVMRKLLVVLNAMVKNNQNWREPSLALDKS